MSASEYSQKAHRLTIATRQHKPNTNQVNQSARKLWVNGERSP
ncbi:hypothetical protein [Rivularia sp. PCC 7116]|nr:hypothetical protein [Rivularia sp. PCC 7116]